MLNPALPDLVSETITRLVLLGDYSDQYFSHQESQDIKYSNPQDFSSFRGRNPRRPLNTIIKLTHSNSHKFFSNLF